MQFIDLRKQYNLLKPQIELAIQLVLEEGCYISGSQVRLLEKELADFVGVKHCVSCANGTDALVISLRALALQPGEAVICTPFTFFATAEAIASLGAIPLFADIDPRSFNIDPECIEAVILKNEKSVKPLKIRGIITVDIFGLAADYGHIRPIASRYGLFILQDAAQGFGAFDGVCRAPGHGDIGTTSFFPAKPLGCYGDGGAIFTNNDGYAELIRSLCVHGKGMDKYDNIRIGYNSRLDTLQAAVLLQKLEIFPAEIESRNKVAAYYTQNLSNLPIIPPLVGKNKQSVWAQYSLTTSVRDRLFAYLKTRNIPVMIYYKTPLHLSKAFQYLGYQEGDFPVSENVSKTIFSLPMHPYLSLEEQNIIISAVKEMFE